jgi:hypothetical protein
MTTTTDTAVVLVFFGCWLVLLLGLIVFVEALLERLDRRRGVGPAPAFPDDGSPAAHGSAPRARDAGAGRALELYDYQRDSSADNWGAW